MSESEFAARMSWTKGSLCQVHAPRGSLNKLKTFNSRLDGEIPAHDTWLNAQIMDIQEDTKHLHLGIKVVLNLKFRGDAFLKINLQIDTDDKR